jgi:hypothetical protein
VAQPLIIHVKLNFTGILSLPQLTREHRQLWPFARHQGTYYVHLLVHGWIKTIYSHSSIDRDGLASNVRGARHAKKRNQARYFFRFSNTSKWCSAHNLIRKPFVCQKLCIEAIVKRFEGPEVANLPSKNMIQNYNMNDKAKPLPLL